MKSTVQSRPELDSEPRKTYDVTMRIRDRFAGRFNQMFPPAQRPAHDNAPGPGMSVDVFREAPLDTSDSEAAAKREEIRRVIFENFFGTPEERVQHGSKCLPFNELAPDAITTMPMALRASYEAELSCARDPRSGRIVRPYIPPGVVEKPNV